MFSFSPLYREINIWFQVQLSTDALADLCRWQLVHDEGTTFPISKSPITSPFYYRPFNKNINNERRKAIKVPILTKIK